MRDLERVLRDAFDDVDRSTRPSESLLVRSRARAEQRRHRRLAATATAALVTIALGVVGITATRSDPDGRTIVIADNSTETTGTSAYSESTVPSLSEQSMARLAALCEAWIPEVQTAEVIFETADGIDAVIAILAAGGADADRVLGELVNSDMARLELFSLQSELESALADLSDATQSVDADRLGKAAVSIRVARSRYQSVADTLFEWGVEECEAER